MKNAHSIVTGVLAVAVIILFILQFTGKKGSNTVSYQTDTSLVSKGVIRIKYVLSDSITENWELAKELKAKFDSDQAIRDQKLINMENNLNAQVAKFQNEARTMTNREIEAEQSRLGRLQEQYMRDGQDLQDQAVIQNQEMMLQLNDSLNAFFPGFAKRVGADIILNSSSIMKTMFYIDPSLDVTRPAIDELNLRYRKANPSPATGGENP